MVQSFRFVDRQEFVNLGIGQSKTDFMDVCVEEMFCSWLFCGVGWISLGLVWRQDHSQEKKVRLDRRRYQREHDRLAGLEKKKIAE